MIISCAICGDVFTGLNPDETVYTTICGHLFHYTCLLEWFERAKTCPQCRHKTSEKNIVRIFFNNNTNLTEEESDPSLLKFRVDSLEFQLKMNEKEVKLLKEEKVKALKQNKGLRSEIKNMSRRVISSEQEAITLSDEVKSLKSYCQQFSEVKLENEELKKELLASKSVNTIINGSVDDAEFAVDNSDLDAGHLRECVKYFKRKIKNLENEHKNTEKDLLYFKRKVASLSKSLYDVKTEIKSPKPHLNENTSDHSIIEITDSDESSVNIFSRTGVPHKKSYVINEDQFSNSCEKRESRESLSLSEDYSLPKPSFIKKPIWKLPSSHKSNSLIGITQTKFQTKSVAPKYSSFSASGDDIYHPTKYTSGKVMKKCKKQLSAAAVSSVKNVWKT